MLDARKGPSTPFAHADDCRIVNADDVQIPWSYVGDGLWKAECVCTMEYFREPLSDDHVRLNPYGSATARHLGQCEFIPETDLAVLWGDPVDLPAAGIPRPSETLA